jgi:hypothetical protein
LRCIIIPARSNERSKQLLLTAHLHKKMSNFLTLAKFFSPIILCIRAKHESKVNGLLKSPPRTIKVAKSEPRVKKCDAKGTTPCVLPHLKRFDAVSHAILNLSDSKLETICGGKARVARNNPDIRAGKWVKCAAVARASDRKDEAPNVHADGSSFSSAYSTIFARLINLFDVCTVFGPSVH